MPLKAKQKSHLRKLAHSLKPVVLIGANGLSESVIEEAHLSLEHHELIKIRIAAGDKLQRQVLIDELQQALNCDVVQVIGRMLVIYKASKKHKIPLPH